MRKLRRAVLFLEKFYQSCKIANGVANIVKPIFLNVFLMMDSMMKMMRIIFVRIFHSFYPKLENSENRKKLFTQKL